MAGSTKLEIDVIKRVIASSGSFDPTGTGLISDSVQDAIVEVNNTMPTGHDAVTLDLGDTTQETITLTGQELSINLATTSTDGAMSATDKTKLDGVSASANNYSHPNHSGDVTSTGDGATSIANNVVTNIKLADVATATIKGRVTAATGDPEDLTATQVRTLLNVADGAQVNVATNIAEGARTTTTVPITSSTGTGATLNIATTSLAGVMSSADKTKLDGLSAIDASIFYDSGAPIATVVSGAGGWSTYYTTAITPGLYFIFISGIGGSVDALQIAINLGTTTVKAPVSMAEGSGSAVARVYSDMFIVDPLDTLTLNVLQKGTLTTIYSIIITKLA